MQKRKLSFLLTIIIAPYILVMLALVMGLIALAFFAGGFSDNTQKQSLHGDLEVTITQEEDTITLVANQRVEAIYYSLELDNSKQGCPSYAPDVETGYLRWEEYQPGKGIEIIYPFHGSLCYTALSDDSNFEAYEYEISTADSGSPVAASLLVIIPMALALLSQLASYIYMLYWLAQTKRELQARGADDIPSTWLYIIPIANIYYIYKYAEGADKVTNGKLPPLLILIIYLVGAASIVMPVCQSQYNKINGQAARQPQQKSKRQI